MSKRFMLVDGNSLLFRAYYGTAYGSPSGVLRSKEGIPTNAIFALASILIKAIEQDQPDHVLVAFDTAAPTFRHQQYEQYKAGRAEIPEDLITQFPLARDILVSLGIKVHEQEGYEADDIIGTLAKMAEEQEFDVHIYSGDKDLLQLITPQTTVHLTRKGFSELQSMDEAALMEFWGVKPSQVPDLKGLMGDPSDNIPGVAGVGEKTAIKLIQAYGSVEGVLQAEIKGKLGEKIASSHEVARFSKEMATILTRVPLPFGLEATEFKGFQVDSFRTFAKRYDMTSLLSKISTTAEKESEVTLPFPPVVKDQGLVAFEATEPVVVVTEIDGINYHRDEVIGFAIASHTATYFISALDAQTDAQFASLLSRPHGVSTLDGKKLLVVAARCGLPIPHINEDITVAAWCYNPQYKDEQAALECFGQSSPSRQESIEKKNIPWEIKIDYIIQLAQSSFRTLSTISSMLTARNVFSLYRDLELPLVSVFARMEQEGIRMDTSVVDKMRRQTEAKLATLEADIYRLAGRTYNINSPTQTAEILFDELQLPANKKRSTSADVLDALKHAHPIVDQILSYRKYSKLLSTYLISLPTYILSDGKIHTIYQQTLVPTGRISSKEPNLQNITVKDEESSELRTAFVASDDDHLLVAFDYSQIELRVLAALAQDQAMLDAFNQKIDIHTATAMKVFGLQAHEVTPNYRRQAKAVNFGIVYGISDWGLADNLGIAPKEAKSFIDRYFATYPHIKSYLDQVVKQCETDGYIRTLLGRYREVPEIKEKNYNLREFGKRVAMNSPIQGTAADLIKLAMLHIDQQIQAQQLKSKMILQVHDELVFDVPYHELMTLSALVEHEMTHAYPNLGVALEVNRSSNHYWSK